GAVLGAVGPAEPSGEKAGATTGAARPSRAETETAKKDAPTLPVVAEEFLDQLRSGPRTGCWGRGEIRLREGFGWGGIRLYQHLRLQERRPFCSNLCLVFEVRCSTFRRGWDGSDRVHGWFASSIPQNLALLNLPRGPGAEGHAVRLTSTSPQVRPNTV
ncbi:unnamed protein product, partial [Durusdinium trenchii]